MMCVVVCDDTSVNFTRRSYTADVFASKKLVDEVVREFSMRFFGGIRATPPYLPAANQTMSLKIH